MKIYLGADHAGFILKEKIKEFLLEKGYNVIDEGAYREDDADDYPEFISKVAMHISQNSSDRGIILGGSGQGEAMVANKFPSVRTAVFYGKAIAQAAIDIEKDKSDDPFEIVKLSRLHNNANILSLGARFLHEKDAFEAVSLWLVTPFSEELQHKRRLSEMAKIEKQV
ncbi:MAG TPA: RpiB/LacA/LacB family sugar-phosphate isomerase [Patescibacteria group bacterium]|nr:RpiB/LacA/LacB family sugar-phosphate isomerase [Patescibacteria group bacterium]